MVREGDHHSDGVTLSSIALLQERFRQLQKMRELRQEKQLLRNMRSESERSSYSTPPVIIPTSKPSFPDLYGEAFLFPRPQYCQLSLSLWPDSENKNAGTPAIAPKSLFGSGRACSTSPVKFRSCDSEIDTSLRL
ncbi:hypothetical protein Salat_0646100 [Sesamum alatum]|uniref:Uncharacterized protein n=1 Tax=Sesamum alatum TaxID=300844 RepID=A0AAE1YRG1_9LAMI|nr:hypothetical protein Salat_0646100 [Sesamum alatum]